MQHSKTRPVSVLQGKLPVALPAAHTGVPVQVLDALLLVVPC